MCRGTAHLLKPHSSHTEVCKRMTVVFCCGNDADTAIQGVAKSEKLAVEKSCQDFWALIY